MTRTPPRRDAFRQFLADLVDQVGHLEHGDAVGAVYVGRRVDQGWRRLDYEVMRWLDEVYPQTVSEAPALDAGQDARTALARAHELRAGLPSSPDLEPWLEALEHANVVGESVADLADAAQRHDAHGAAISAHLARRAFSAYRLAKYRWMDEALASGELSRDSSYQWLEA